MSGVVLCRAPRLVSCVLPLPLPLPIRVRDTASRCIATRIALPTVPIRIRYDNIYEYKI